MTALVSLLLALTCGAVPFARASAQPSDPGASLHRLFHQSDEASLRRNPFAALSRVDRRYADRLGYNLSDEYFDAERAAAQHDLRQLSRIKRAGLPPTQQIEYDAFKWERKISLRALEPRYLNVIKVLPIESFTGFHLDYADIASGNGIATFSTVADYQSNLVRHHEYALYIDSVIARLKEGVAAGTVQPKLIVEKVIRQLDVQLADSGASIFDAPVHHFPDSIPEWQRAALLQSYAATTREIVMPALKRLRDYLRTDYLPYARASIGLSQMKEGAALYEFLIEQQTTLRLGTDALHMMACAKATTAVRPVEFHRRLGRGRGREAPRARRASPAARLRALGRAAGDTRWSLRPRRPELHSLHLEPRAASRVVTRLGDVSLALDDLNRMVRDIDLLSERAYRSVGSGRRRSDQHPHTITCRGNRVCVRPAASIEGRTRPNRSTSYATCRRPDGCC